MIIKTNMNEKDFKLKGNKKEPNKQIYTLHFNRQDDEGGKTLEVNHTYYLN